MSPELYDSLFTLNGDVQRNIKSIRKAQDLFDDLSDSPEDREYAKLATASATTEQSPLIARAFAYGTVITYPFLPNNWHATRFSDGTRYGVWYGSMEVETTVYETTYHWVRFVRDSFPDYAREIVAERRVLRTRVNALLIDLRDKHRKFPGLIDPDSYVYTHEVGRYLHEQRQNGLLVKSARCDGINCAVFNPDVLSDPRDVCFLTYRFTPTEKQLTVERTGRKRWLKLAV